MLAEISKVTTTLCRYFYTNQAQKILLQSAGVLVGLCLFMSAAVSASASSAPLATVASTVSAVQTKPVAVVAAAAPAAPACSPDTSYLPAGAITPEQASGLNVIVDQPSTYIVYGNSWAQIAAEMTECTPVKASGTGGFTAHFAASTANNISWRAIYNTTGNSQCKVSRAAVTVHINHVFPQWQPDSNSPAALSAEWQAYSQSLKAYENGHAQLDEQGAAQVLASLENLPATNCSAINQAATATASEIMQQTLAANTYYDVSHSFGPKVPQTK